jgi:DNA repair photolyase
MFVRWQNLAVEAEERARLPGYKDEAVVRHFDAPGAIETRFYEVRAKSILNPVPEASRMPFRWTINPYRGCSHGCLYCLSYETPVLMADGRHRPIGELEVGDRIYGTTREGPHRTYAVTPVLDRWITIKRPYRLVLSDGTELIASGDHRFLSDRGWEHVVNTPPGERDRPHLTLRDQLVGTGAFATQPRPTFDYRRGYLTAIAGGDGRLNAGEDGRLGRTRAVADRFRLALADLEPLRRAREYLAAEEIDTTQRVLQRAARNHGETIAIGPNSRSLVERITALVAWPLCPSLDWCRGFLAGMFDANGHRGASALRIANADAQLLAWTEDCARRLGLSTSVDRTGHEGGLASVRVGGGLSEHLRFLHLTDPAIDRKRSIESEAAATSADLTVTAIEPLSEPLPLYDITTGTGDFIANGVVSHNCFARPTHKYLDFDIGRDFEREVVVKVNAPELLRVELARPSWKREHVALGTNTDPYQWVEGRYKLMPGIWEAMRDAANPCSVLTKSPLLLRDLRLMQEIAERTEFSAALSVPTLDEKAWRATEPHTPNPRARLEAVAELTRAGIRTGVLIAPLMPRARLRGRRCLRHRDRAAPPR